jgi:glycosyltransferase involved in cell wall biosynthesis
MRIGIDCRTILNPVFGEKAGIGHYTYYLVNSLLDLDKRNDYVLFFDELLDREAAERLVGGRKNVRMVFFPFHKYRHLNLDDYSKYLINTFFEKERLHVLHLPSPHLYTGRVAKKMVVTLHDLAVFRHPEWFPKTEAESQKLIKEAVKNADKIISVSNFTKNEAIEILKIPPEKIKIVPNGVDTKRHFLLTEDVISPDDCVDLGDLNRKFKTGENYILYLGAIEPRKNVLGAVAAFKIFQKESGLDYNLVIAGLPGIKSEKILAELKREEKESNGRIKYVGHIPHADKFPLIKYARCFLFISKYEGFGLPPLEAMDIGTPVVASDIPSISEVAGKGAMLYAPDDYAGIAKGMEKLMQDGEMRKTLIKEGLKRARLYNWPRSARETLEVFKRMW